MADDAAPLYSGVPTTRRMFLAYALALKLPAEDSRFFEKTFSTWDQCTLVFQHFPPCDFTPDSQAGSKSPCQLAMGRIRYIASRAER